ncbi:MAG: F0F1 ATP synthase subunit delta [Alphaproteobacteria bacterium]|nr:F0F1 ATP synthase subunit delta [Alphaproteobacteria bacterium]
MASQAEGYSGLAGRYAGALFDLADEQRSLEAVAGDLERIKALLAESEDLRRLIRSPILKRDEQARAIGAVLAAADIGQVTCNFCGVVARNRRLFALPAMIDAFLAILARRRGEISADVTAARPLSPDRVAAVTEALRRVLGAKVAVNLRVDPALLGGLVVKVGSRMIDSSLQSKLHRLQLTMKGVG